MTSGAPVAGASWDVVVVGAGPAGCAVAITLAGFGWRVLLVEARAAPRFKLGESIAPGAVGLVRQFLGPSADVLDRVAAGFRTAGNVSLWAGAQPDTTDFFYTPAGHGLCVDRLAFDQALRDRATAAGATLVGGRFVSCVRQVDGLSRWRVTLDQAQAQAQAGGACVHQARFLVDASGRVAVVGRALGVACQPLDGLFAYAQWYDSAMPDQDVYTRIESGPLGWWYSNRLPGAAARRLLVFHTDHDLPAARQAAHQAGFDALLQASTHLRPLLRDKGYAADGSRPVRGAPAGSQRLQAFGGPDWLAAGDAAQAYDPLSSQGIWKALDSGSEAGHQVHYQLQAAVPAGRPQSQVQQYLDGQALRWDRYVLQRNFYYAQQDRWREGAFWQRRRGD
ncbi:NAD(P)/FAD-dependent oxidoreductase [Castellaniella hirudinis]|uniref:NAD(P)/FAD-dependent oxidoreductase n=1 Tax=Castellaniella hirudinis TaxID=1144617 RepID=UPI0039C45A2A